VTFTEIVQQV